MIKEYIFTNKRSNVLRVILTILLFVISSVQAENKPVYVVDNNDLDKSLTVAELFILMDSGLMIEESDSKSYNSILNRIQKTKHKIIEQDDNLITVEMINSKDDSIYLVKYYFEKKY